MSIDDFEDMKTDQAFTKKSLYGRANEMTYGGALSFLRRKYTTVSYTHLTLPTTPYV